MSCVSLQVEEATVVMEDDSPAEPPCSAGSLRNLSFWSIGIPYIDLCDDDNKRDKIPVFCIDVERNDRKEGNKVLRQRGHMGEDLDVRRAMKRKLKNTVNSRVKPAMKAHRLLSK